MNEHVSDAEVRSVNANYRLADLRADLTFLLRPGRMRRALPVRPDSGVDWRLSGRAAAQFLSLINGRNVSTSSWIIASTMALVSLTSGALLISLGPGRSDQLEGVAAVGLSFLLVYGIAGVLIRRLSWLVAGRFLEAPHGLDDGRASVTGPAGQAPRRRPLRAKD